MTQSMDAMTSEAYERIAKARYALHKKLPFFGHLLTVIPVVVTSCVETPQGKEVAIPTMAVSNEGRVGVLYANPVFVKALMDEELLAALLHEVLHPANGFFQRQSQRDLLDWNRAHDFAINLIVDETMELNRATLPMAWPTGENRPACFDYKYQGLTAEEIYLLIRKEPLQMKVPSSGEGDGEPAKGFQDSTDCLLIASQTPEQAERQAQAVRNMVAEAMAIHEARSKAGVLPGSLVKLVDALLRTKSDWVERYMHQVDGRLPGAQVSYARPSRRSAALDIVLPGRSRRNPEICVIFDTSQSNLDALDRFVAVTRELVESRECRLRIIQVDVDVREDVIVEDFDEMLSLAKGFEAKGGGGTAFDALPQALEEGEEGVPDLAILYTDGEPMGWPSPDAWPCELLVVTTGTMPPEGYEAVRQDLEEVTA